MKELGEYLKETRENIGISIEEATEDLNMSVNTISNIESGNTRAFRDMLTLKEHVKNYAKYLGLDPEKIIDEFNDFMFEHTSKISLTDILEAEEKGKSKNEATVTSPYTKPGKKYIDIKYIKLLGMFLLIAGFLVTLIAVIKLIVVPKEKIINKELLCNKLVGEIYEYTK